MLLICLHSVHMQSLCRSYQSVGFGGPFQRQQRRLRHDGGFGLHDGVERPHLRRRRRKRRKRRIKALVFVSISCGQEKQFACLSFLIFIEAEKINDAALPWWPRLHPNWQPDDQNSRPWKQKQEGWMRREDGVQSFVRNQASQQMPIFSPSFEHLNWLRQTCSAWWRSGVLHTPPGWVWWKAVPLTELLPRLLLHNSCYLRRTSQAVRWRPQQRALLPPPPPSSPLSEASRKKDVFSAKGINI